jgi:hypothetical protein
VLVREGVEVETGSEVLMSSVGPLPGLFLALRIDRRRLLIPPCPRRLPTFSVGDFTCALLPLIPGQV